MYTEADVRTRLFAQDLVVPFMQTEQHSGCQIGFGGVAVPQCGEWRVALSYDSFLECIMYGTDLRIYDTPELPMIHRLHVQYIPRFTVESSSLQTIPVRCRLGFN